MNLHLRADGTRTYEDWWETSGPKVMTDFVPQSDQNFFAAPDKTCAPGSSETRVVQPLWDNICEAFSADETLPNKPVSGYKYVSIGTRRPGNFFSQLRLGINFNV